MGRVLTKRNLSNRWSLPERTIGKRPKFFFRDITRRDITMCDSTPWETHMHCCELKNGRISGSADMSCTKQHQNDLVAFLALDVKHLT